MYNFGGLFTSTIWCDLHRLRHKYLNTRYLQFSLSSRVSDLSAHSNFTVSPVTTFWVSCTCLCLFHPGFLSFLSIFFPGSRLFPMGLMTSVIWTYKACFLCFFLFFFISPLFSLPILSASVSFKYGHCSEAGPTRVLPSVGDNFSLLCCTSCSPQSFSLFFLAFFSTVQI